VVAVMLLDLFIISLHEKEVGIIAVEAAGKGVDSR